MNVASVKNKYQMTSIKETEREQDDEDNDLQSLPRKQRIEIPRLNLNG